MGSTGSNTQSPLEAASFGNPVLYEDLPDPEVIRVGDVYYMSASSFHFSPGAPFYASSNLVDWEQIGNSVPELLPRARFSLDNEHERPAAYGKGVWASTVKYRQSDGTFYFYSPLQGTDQTGLWKTKDPRGTWTPCPPIDKFYYDLGLFFDDDDTPYLAYGTKTIEVAQLSKYGSTEVKSKCVYTSDLYLEGARMYKIRGTYYIWVTTPGDAQWVLKSSKGPFGPYEGREVIAHMRSPVLGGGPPHQGALVDTPSGDWYYMAFTDAFPVGRVPILAPVTFDGEGWPHVEADYSQDKRGQWRSVDSHPLPQITAGSAARKGVHPCTRRHSFDGSKALDHCWQWNHNPDNKKWSLAEGRLVLETATVTDSLHRAPNTLTHRTLGPGSMATICIDISQLQNGDRCGLSLFRDECGYIGVHKDGDVTKVVHVEDCAVGPRSIPVGFMNARPVALDWQHRSNGSIEAEVATSQNRLWLRVKADLRSIYGEGQEKLRRKATFEYACEEGSFTQLGAPHTLTRSCAGYVGHRFGIFNFATKALGGRLSVELCDIEILYPQDI